MVALIFAAGIGSRLKPFTDFHPKALAEIHGKPILQHVIERLRDEANISKMVINVHHFPQQIRQFLKQNQNFGVEIDISDESDQLLDTGGGLLKAFPLLTENKQEPILLHNADILTDFPLNDFLHNHIQSRRDISLLVAQRCSSRQLYFNNEMELKGWQNLKNRELKPKGFHISNGLNKYAFGGVHIVEPTILSNLIEFSQNVGPVFSTIPFYLENINKLKIGGYTPNSAFNWFDIGSPEKLEVAKREFHNAT